MLLPGMDGTGDLFAPFQAALGAPPPFGVQVVRYPRDRALEYPALEQIAAAALPDDDDFVLLAESFSGPIAIALAAAAPRRLRGVVLCATFARNPRPLSGPLRFMLNTMPLNAIPPHVSAPVLLGHFATPERIDALQRALAPVTTPVLRARLRSVLAVDVSAKLARVKAPLLYLRARHDRVVPPAAWAHVEANCPHATCEEIDAPHFVLQAAPDATAQVVRRFVEDCAAAQG